MDIYPTVCSLFGVKTDQQLTYGHSIFDDSATSIGVGYLNGYTWGALGYDAETDSWKIWRTVNFMDYAVAGETLTKEQLSAVTPLVNQTYGSIFVNQMLFNKNGFQNLDKCYQYNLRKQTA